MPRQKSTHVDDPTAVGRRLRKAREGAGLSQRQLSFSGCSPAYISRIEAGDRIPSLQLLRELGKRLGVSEDFLATGAADAGPATRQRLVDAEVALRLDDVDLARELYEGLLAAAADERTRAEALEGLGHVAYRQGNPRDAIELFEESIALLGVNFCERPLLAEMLGRSYALLGELGRAIALFERCRERFREQGDPINEIRFAVILGYALTDNGSFADAERVLGETLEAGKSVRDPITRARLYWSQSRLRGEQGQSELSAQYALEALETLRATEDTYLLALAHQLLAHAYNDSDRSSEALELLREARPVLEAAATPIQIAHYEVEEARALAAVGEHEEAAALAMRARSKLGDAQPVEAGRAYVLLAEIFDRTGDDARARELYELGIELLESQPPSRYLVAAYKRLGALLEQQGRPDEALEVLKRALGVQERAGRALG